MMILPLTLFVVAMFYFGLHSQTIVAALEQIAALTM
jgi:hypothetical protein